MSLKTFFIEFLKHPGEVAAIFPTSSHLADAMVELGINIARKKQKVLKVLEVGGGTGAVTERLIQALNPQDELTIIEANKIFFAKLQENIEKFREKYPKTFPRVMALQGYFPDTIGMTSSGFDLVIASVPFNAFPRDKAVTMFKSLYELVGEGGAFVYQDYTWMRNANNAARRFFRTLNPKWGGPAGIPPFKTIFKDTPKEQRPKIHERFVLLNIPSAKVFCLEKRTLTFKQA